MRLMKVAFLLDAFPVTSEVFILRQMAELLQRGVGVAVLAERSFDAVQHELFDRFELERRTHFRSGAETGALGWLRLAGRAVHANAAAREARVAEALLRPRVASLRSAHRALDVAEFEPFDVMHCHFGHVALDYLQAAELRPSVPLVVSFHGFDANVFPRGRPPHVYGPLFARASIITVNSRFLRARLVELGAPEHKLSLLPMAVDVRNAPLVPRRRQPGEPLRIMTVGRLIEAKGTAVGLRAVAHLRKRGIDVEYSVFGGGPLEGELRALAVDLGIFEHVHFRGPRPNQLLSAAYTKHHVFVLPSVVSAEGDQETQGLVVQEAQATGMPVVVSDIGGIREGIDEPGSGVSFRAGDPLALSSAVERLLDRENEWPAMGEAGRALVEARYSCAVHGDELLRIYERAKF
jgi:colanic acid/amylovoran biosynthesis glycosyltransferase